MPADGIFYGGHPVVLDWNDELANALEKLWPESRWPFRDTRYSEGFESSALRVARDPWFESPYPIEPAPGINEIVIPTGAARYAKALILVDQQTMIALAKAVWGRAENIEENEDAIILEDEELAPSGNWGDKQNYLDLVFRYNGKSLTWSMTALTPQLTLGSLWIVPLVDQRYFLNRKLRAVEFTDGTDMTWTELFDELQTISGMFIEKPNEFNEFYLNPDRETFESEGVGVGNAIDAAAMSVGLRVVPITNGTELKLMDAQDSIDLIKSNYFKDYTEHDPVDGPYIPQDRQLGGFYPQKAKPKELKLVAPILRNYFNCSSQEEYSSTINSDGIETIIIFTTCWIQYTGETKDSGSNSQLYNLTEQLREDLEKWLEWSHNGAFAAVAEYELTGHDDYWSIGWRPGKVVNSQVRSLPNDFFPRIQISQSPAFFRHKEDAVIARTTSEISVREDDQYGSGTAVPRKLTETGTEEDLKRSDGSEIEITIWNGGGDAIAVDRSVQCKRLNCLAVVDVDYCTSVIGEIPPEPDPPTSPDPEPSPDPLAP